MLFGPGYRWSEEVDLARQVAGDAFEAAAFMTTLATLGIARRDRHRHRPLWEWIVQVVVLLIAFFLIIFTLIWTSKRPF